MYTGAWAAATGAAVMLSWLGVHSVLADEVLDPQHSLTVQPGSLSGTGGPLSSSTRPPGSELGSATARAPQPSAAGARTALTTRAADGVKLPPGGGATGAPHSPGASPRASSGASGSAAPSAGQSASGAASGSSATATAGSGSGEVRSYRVNGGRVVLEERADSAELVSATPEPGWEMQVWHGDQWMRVDFSDGGTHIDSVFVAWNGHPPTVETVNR
jgi:hypothetical protein